MNKVTKKELTRRLANMEFANDQLQAELSYVHELLGLVGFSNGLHTLKLAAQEIVAKQEGESSL